MDWQEGSPQLLSVLRQSSVSECLGKCSCSEGWGQNRLFQVSLVQLIVALVWGLIMIQCKIFFFLTGNKGKKEILQDVYRGSCEGSHRNQHEK